MKSGTQIFSNQSNANYEPISIRWTDTASAYYSGNITLNDVVNEYRAWVKQPAYAIGYIPDYNQPVIHPLPSKAGHQSHWCQYKGFKVAKRGNDVYRYHVRQRFKPLNDLCTIGKHHRFIPEGSRTANSHLFMITLTYDTKLKPINKAWKNIGKELNAFLSNIKRDYGEIQVLRCFESFKKGSNYPHVHMILRLNDTTLPCFRHTNKDGKISYRIENHYKEKIQQHWHSYINVCAVTTTGGVGYILKYITKEMYTKDDYNTMTMLWLFHKQSYSISYKFTYNLGKDMEKMVLDSHRLDIRESNSNNNFNNWKYLCTKTTINPFDKWHFKVKPPPELDGTMYNGEISELFNNFDKMVIE